MIIPDCPNSPLCTFVNGTCAICGAIDPYLIPETESDEDDDTPPPVEPPFPPIILR